LRYLVAVVNDRLAPQCAVINLQFEQVIEARPHDARDDVLDVELEEDEAKDRTPALVDSIKRKVPRIDRNQQDHRLAGRRSGNTLVFGGHDRVTAIARALHRFPARGYGREIFIQHLPGRVTFRVDQAQPVVVVVLG
jgi:hypothetical protein